MAADPQIVPPLRKLVPSLSTADSESSADNLFRQFCRYLALAYVLSFIAYSGPIVESTKVVPLWWTIAVVLAVHGVAVVMFAASFRHPGVTWVRWSGQALAIGYGLAIATWPLVWNGGLIDGGYGMWFTQFNGFAAATAAVVWRVRWSLPYLIYVVVSVQFVNDAVRTPEYETAVLTDIAWSFCLCALPYAIAVAAMRSGRVLDATRAGYAQAAVEAAATVARADERARFDALTHDRVMSTLLAAARLPMSDVLVSQANNTLLKLDLLGSTDESDGPAMDVATAIREICGSVTGIAPTIPVHTTLAPDAAHTSYPGPVVTAIADVAAEAARNSVRHAGPDATRSVDVIARDGHLSVHIQDNGVGFDPTTVGPDRLGVAGSIRGRMEHVRGGSAEVISAPGHGTSILVTWSRP